jgi:hypothetical protein
MTKKRYILVTPNKLQHGTVAVLALESLALHYKIPQAPYAPRWKRLLWLAQQLHAMDVNLRFTIYCDSKRVRVSNYKLRLRLSGTIRN